MQSIYFSIPEDDKQEGLDRRCLLITFPADANGAPVGQTQIGVILTKCKILTDFYLQVRTDLAQIMVPAVPLYTLMTALKLTTIDYFNLDVEGSELEVLETIPPRPKVMIKVFRYIPNDFFRNKLVIRME